MKYKIPIVYYHSIANTTLSVKIENFVNQMKHLKDNDFNTILYKDLISNIYDKKKKNIVITFDDCFFDVYENALPVLKEYGFVATFFATLGYDKKTLWGSEKEQRWNSEKTDSFNIPYVFMNEQHRKELVSLGMEIGSHTVNHYNLDDLKTSILEYELCHSKQLLEDELCIKIESFCYPRGRYSQTVIEAVKSAGYKSACITKRGYFDDAQGKFEVLRFGIGNDNNYFYAVVDNNIFSLKYRIIKKIKRILGIIK